jgi:hypothetical protein
MIKVLTQGQAAKKYGDHLYREYEPMILVTGTRRDFQKYLRTQLVLMNNKEARPIELGPPQSLVVDGSTLVEPIGTSLDVNKKEDMRLVIWLK